MRRGLLLFLILCVSLLGGAWSEDTWPEIGKDYTEEPNIFSQPLPPTVWPYKQRPFYSIYFNDTDKLPNQPLGTEEELLAGDPCYWSGADHGADASNTLNHYCECDPALYANCIPPEGNGCMDARGTIIFNTAYSDWDLAFPDRDDFWILAYLKTEGYGFPATILHFELTRNGARIGTSGWGWTYTIFGLIGTFCDDNTSFAGYDNEWNRYLFHIQENEGKLEAWSDVTGGLGGDPFSACDGTGGDGDVNGFIIGSEFGGALTTHHYLDRILFFDEDPRPGGM